MLEILVALSLTAILLAFLFTSMAGSARFERELEKARSAMLERQRCQTRLQDLFITLSRDMTPPLYTKLFPNESKESLVAVFDNGIDPEPAFSGPVLGRLFLDPEQNLSLVIWPLDGDKKSRPWRTEILLSQVTDYRFEFFGKKPESPRFSWGSIWPMQRIETPALIRLIITHQGTEIPYAFFLSIPEPFITYVEKT